MFENVEMRKVFGDALKEMMASDERIVVIDADLAKANGTFGLRADFPERALDVGVAEANMASVAAGLASYGFIPFITSFAPFASRRICDQIAISICYAKQNVKIVGSDPGITAEYNGGTHMGLEDVGVLRSLPNLVIFEPVDNIQMHQAMPQIVAHNGPVYVRMFRKVTPQVFPDNYKFDLFKADTLQSGTDVSLLASGIMLGEAILAAKELAKEGISAEVINVHTIKPIDKDAVIATAKKTNAVVVCENHNVIGGLYSAVCEVLSNSYPTVTKSVAINDEFGIVGKLDELKEYYNLNYKEIVKQAKLAIAAKK